MEYNLIKIIKDMPAKDYHAIDACSSSWLKIARRGAVEFVTKKNNKSEERNESLLLGELVHSLVFPQSPNPVSSEFAIVPEGIDRRTKEGKLKYAELDVDPRPKISQKVFDQAQAIANNVLAIKMLQNIKRHQDSFNEATCLFDIDGLPCKCRWDMINPYVGLILDLKTTSSGIDPQSFSKTIAQWLYDQQAAFYADAAERAYDKKFKVAFVVVSTTAPYDACLYEVDDQMLDVGRQLYKENIINYKIFSGIKSTDIKDLIAIKQFQKISLPAWATDLSRR